MRIFALLYFILFQFLIVNGQQGSHLEKALNSDTLAHVAGKLKNFQKDFYKDLYINYTILSPDFQGVKQRTSEIKDDGSFKIDLEENYPYQKIRFNLGDVYHGFLIANTNLQINIDLNEVVKKNDHFDSKAITFSGDDGAITNFYNKYHEYKDDKKADLRRRKFSALRNRTSQGSYKVKQVMSIYEELEKIESTFCKKNGSENRWILENERQSEYFGDLASIFIGKPIPKDLWQEIMSHLPLIVSDMSNRFYAILATKLWSHEEREIRAFSRMIFKRDAEDEETKKAIDLFMIEQDKRNAGVSYDNEVYAKGLEDYVQKYESQLADAKLDLFLSKLKKLPEGKRGLVGIKGQPLSSEDRRIYVEKVIPLVSLEWQAKMIESEMAKEIERISNISKFMSSAATDGRDPKLGTLREHLPSGGGMWVSKANNINELLRQIRNFYKEKALVIYLWKTECGSCVEELKQSGLTFDKIEGEPIDILTLAMNHNSSEEEWKDKLLTTYARGEHIYLDKNLTSKIIAYFQLPPVPSYLYFDGSGNFIPYKLNSISDLDVKEILSSGE